MKRILKIQLQHRQPVTAALPMGSKCIKVGVQRGAPTAWFETSTLAPRVRRELVLCVTGKRYRRLGRHLGTFITGLWDSEVYHLYSRRAS